MANYNQLSSFVIPSSDRELTRKRMAAIEAFVVEADPLPVELFPGKVADVEAALVDCDGDLGFAWDVDDAELWIGHDETITMETAVAVAMLMLDLQDDNGTYCVEWANTCSRAIVGDFGGGAVAFNRRTSMWKNTGEVAAELADALKKQE